MSPFTILALCFQACLVQSVLGQVPCGCGVGCNSLNSFSSPLLNVGGYGSNLVSSSGCGNYGGSGTGTVSANGAINACGTTCASGCVPVIGSVSFGGCTPASGSVSITGQCGCGCV